MDWGDGSSDDWHGPHQSDEEIIIVKTWEEMGTYEIKVKAKDNDELESEWSDPLSVTIPKTKVKNFPFLNFLDNHPKLFPILRYIFDIS